MPLFMVIPAGQKLGPLNGPNCIPKDPPVVTAWGTFDGCGTCTGCTPGNDITGIYVNQEEAAPVAFL